MTLTVERDGGVAVVTLTRPERLNAFDQGLFDVQTAAFEAPPRARTLKRRSWSSRLRGKPSSLAEPAFQQRAAAWFAAKGE